MPTLTELKQSHEDARTARRKLEAEIAGVDVAIGKAIKSGDVAGLVSLKARKVELPALLAAASKTESDAQRAVYDVERDAAAAAVRTAEDDLAKVAADRRAADAEYTAKVAGFVAAENAARARLVAAQADVRRATDTHVTARQRFEAVLGALVEAL